MSSWTPPPGSMTFACLSIREAIACVGKDAIVRDDPYFGRRGVVKRIIPDEEKGFLVAVIIYKRDRNTFGCWEEMHNPPANARRFLPPDRVELV